MLRLRFTRSALRDLDAAYRYMARDVIDRADAVIEPVKSRCQMLKVFPRRGRRRLEFGDGIRAFSVPPFIVFYCLTNDEREVEILRVIDGRRNLPTVYFSSLVAVELV